MITEGCPWGKKILLPLLQGLKSVTFWLCVQHSNHWAIPAPSHKVTCSIAGKLKQRPLRTWLPLAMEVLMSKGKHTTVPLSQEIIVMSFKCLFHKRSYNYCWDCDVFHVPLSQEIIQLLLRLWCLSSASFTRDHTITLEIVMSFKCLFHKRSYNYSWDELQERILNGTDTSCKIQTPKRFKGTLFIGTKQNQQIFGVMPFVKLQNDTEQLNGQKRWQMKWQAKPLICFWLAMSFSCPVFSSHKCRKNAIHRVTQAQYRLVHFIW